MVRIILYEIRKLLEQPIILFFFIASVLLNTIYITTVDLNQSYLDYVQDIKEKTGNVISDEFKGELAHQSSSKDQQRLLTETRSLENVFLHYSTAELGEEIIDFYQIQGSVAEQMTKKYETLAPVVFELDETHASLEVGAAGETMSVFTFIRNRLFNTILAESLLFAVLIGLYGSTSETFTRTDRLLLSSKTGRNIQVSKYVASVLLTFLFYLTMILVTFSMFNLVHPIGQIWNTSISTQFHLNVYFPQLLEVPFIPWSPMTLFNYTFLSIVLGAFLVIICHGFNFLIGLWTNHLFQGFLVFVAVYVVFLSFGAMVDQLGWWSLQAVLMWHPVSLWRLQGYWFTEMGPYAILPWQESIAMAVNLLLLGISCIVTGAFYSTKEVK
ncbi:MULTISPECIES: hypothetical protein [Bacillaceae]|uniref:ABC-2 family transporter protein n=1 Tax=Alkalicoccobacillus plakortidis TaxID=444060 RepID=A0A9D5DTW1_9BACI|nr:MULTISPECIES: hypothetical protein [Bacillaceae]KQL58706.1 hypothetical protein AN965_01665 [Alkalicoccobacillus plakortidis]